MSGGVAGAPARTLTIMAAGDEALFASLRPLLEALGSNVVLVGAVGELWARAAASVDAGADGTEIVRMLEDDAGLVIGDE